MGKIDVKGAFIQTEMSGTPVYIKCGGNLKKQILGIYPALSKYVGSDGMLYCKLKKALYGCVQASKLWYKKLKFFLREQGYIHGDVDPCVFKKVVDGNVYLLLVYVDDILVIGEEREIRRLEAEFLKEFRWITMSVGCSHSYIGMQVSVQDGVVTLDMKYYLECILKDHDNPRAAVTPGGKNGFMVDEKAEKHADAEKKVFHTVEAKLLYLSKRARPDIISVVGLLCTRVREPTVEDQVKLRRVLGYLHGTRDKMMVLRPCGVFKCVAYIDTSFSAYPDGKSHSRVVLLVGGVAVYYGSRKQKCVSKSPTEAELVALSDNLALVELFSEFVAFVTDSEEIKPLVYQDSTSVITMVTEGGGVVRTKHMRTRMHLVLEAVRQNRVKIGYVGTKLM
jgi:hypothetical protein